MRAMKFPARSLAAQILAAALCLCIPWPAFAGEIAPAVAETAAAPAGATFDPLFHQELQLSVGRLFPSGAEAGVASLQALRVMRSEYDFAAKTGSSEPAAQARAEAAEFLAAALKEDGATLARRLSAAGLTEQDAAARIVSAAADLQRRAAGDKALAKALREVSEPIPAAQPGRLARIKSMIVRTMVQWRVTTMTQPVFVTAEGMPVSEAMQTDRLLRKMRAGIEWPASSRVRAFSNAAEWIPTSKKVARLQKLAKEQPETAFVEASQVLADQKEARLEVRAASLRIVAAQPAPQAFPVILKILNDDPSWYLKRMAARWIGAHAAELAAQKDEVIKALKPSYRNSNPSVRLMTRWALEQFGVDPGPEVVPIQIVTVPAPKPGQRPALSGEQAKPGQAPNQQLSIAKRLLKWTMYGLSALLLWSMLATPAKKPATPAPAPAAQTQTIPAPSVDASASPEAKMLAEINKNIEQIKDAQQKQAAIAEKQEKDREDAKAQAGKAGSQIFGVIFQIAMFILPLGLIFWLMRKQMGGGGGGLLSPGGKTNMNVEHPNVRFSDVAGVDDALKDVRQIIDYLDNPAKFKKLGAHAPRGVLLEGPPGTGKTLMARALAGESNAAFLSMKGSDFIQMFVGLGAMRVRELFNEARKNQPAIIFIDELDAIGGSRDYGGASGGESEHRQTLVALLAELDGFLKMDNVIVVAATNRAQDLDEALMRPGRFDRKIFVGNPDILGREAILAVHGAKMRLGPDADLEFTAKRTPGLSGAAMANIVNESALQAAQRDAEEIAQKDLQRAVDKETFGDQRNLFLDEKTKRRVAEHEAGHALAQYFAMTKRGVEGAKVDNKITIIPHGKAALGYAEKAQKGEADTYLQTQDELEADIVGAMGGRAAEETIYPGKKGISTGPGSDIADHADRMARAMIEQLGMSPEVGIINAGPDPRDPMGRSWDPLESTCRHASLSIL